MTTYVIMENEHALFGSVFPKTEEKHAEEAPCLRRGWTTNEDHPRVRSQGLERRHADRQ